MLNLDLDLDFSKLRTPTPKANTSRRVKSPRILFIPRISVPLTSRPRVFESCLRSLEINPSDRQKWNIDAIHAVLSTWPSFSSRYKTEKEQREVCRSITSETHPPFTLIYKPGDFSDGWYLVLSGSVCVFEPSENQTPNSNQIANSKKNTIYNDQDFNNNNNNNYNNLNQDQNTILNENELQNPVYKKAIEQINQHMSQIKSFRLKRVCGVHSSFGGFDMKKDYPQADAAITTEQTVLLRLDPFLYRMTMQLSYQTELIIRSKYLQTVPELDPLKNDTLLYDNLSEIITEKELLPGTSLTPDSSLLEGWFIIIDGQLARKRYVDFSRVDRCCDRRTLCVGSIPIPLPEGEKEIITDYIQTNHLSIDPYFSRNLKRPFSLHVLSKTPVKIWVLKVSDINELIPHDIRTEIISHILADPPDEEQIKIWIQKEKVRKWNIYKKRCEKEARQYVKADKAQGTAFFERTPRAPKSFKEFKSPRHHHNTRQSHV